MFSIVKSAYKRMFLQRLMKNERLQAKQMITAAIESVDRDKVRACLRHSMNEIE